MSKKARRYLLLLAGLLTLVAFVGYQFLAEYQKLQSINSDKTKFQQQLDAVKSDNDTKQKELDEANSEESIIEKGHEIGWVLPGEIKIVDKDK